MNELATQAANDTNTSSDRTAIQKEINALTSELDRIASTTQFNTQNLLDGKFSGKKLQVGALQNQKISIKITTMNAKGIGITAGTNNVVTTFTKAGKAMIPIRHHHDEEYRVIVKQFDDDKDEYIEKGVEVDKQLYNKVKVGDELTYKFGELFVNSDENGK